MKLNYFSLISSAILALVFSTNAHAQNDLPASTDLDNFVTNELQKNVYCNNSAPDTGALNKISGFAKTAGTTGGEASSPNIVYVKNYADSGADSLRDAIVAAGNFSNGGIVRFMTHLNGDTIRLETPILIPSDISIDGSCVDIRIEARADMDIFQIAGTSNIIIRNLELSHFGHNLVTADHTGFYDENSNYTYSIAKDIISVYSKSDQIWPDKISISNNSFQNCGDECIGINMSVSNASQTQDWSANPKTSNITISYNHFENSRRAMLITTQACVATPSDPLSTGSLDTGDHIACDYFQDITSTGTAQQAEDILLNSPIKVTVEGNVYQGIENRMPLIAYGVYAHSVGNLVLQRNLTGTSHSVYSVTQAGILLSENNLIVNTQFGGGPYQNITSVRIATKYIADHPNPQTAAAGNSTGDIFSSGNIKESSFIDHDSDSATPNVPIWRYNNNSSYVGNPATSITGYVVSKPDFVSNNIRDVMTCILGVAGPDKLLDHASCGSF